MNIKEKVLNVYPDAVLLQDSHNYGSQPGGQFQYIIVHNIPKEFICHIQNGIIIMDLESIIKNNFHVLSKWSSVSEEAWNSAWIQIEEKTQNIFTM